MCPQILHRHPVFVFAKTGNPSWMGTLGYPPRRRAQDQRPAAQGEESSGEIDLSGVEGAVIKSIMVDPWPVGSWAARMESSPNAAQSFLFPSLFIFPPPPSFLSPPSKAWRSCLPFQHSLHHFPSSIHCTTPNPTAFHNFIWLGFTSWLACHGTSCRICQRPGRDWNWNDSNYMW